MPSLSPSLLASLAAASHSVVFQVLAIILSTFVLEDAATILTAMQVQDGAVTLPVALVALYIGIVSGDAGLYGMGRLASLWPRARRWLSLPPDRIDALTSGQTPIGWRGGKLFGVVFASRFLPGTRLPLYTTCGLLNSGFRVFLAATIAATMIWTSLLFALSLRVGRMLLDHLGAWRWAGILGFVLSIILVGRIVARMQHQSR